MESGGGHAGIRELVVAGRTILRSRFIDCSYDTLKVILKGGDQIGRTILDFDRIAHLPDTWVSRVREPVRLGHLYLLVLDFGKWPILDECIEVTGVGDPLVGRVEHWLN